MSFMHDHALHRGTPQDFARQILDEDQATALETAVRDRLNIVVAGGTGSGKTTLANSLLALVASTADRRQVPG